MTATIDAAAVDEPPTHDVEHHAVAAADLEHARLRRERQERKELIEPRHRSPTHVESGHPVDPGHAAGIVRFLRTDRSTGV